MLLDELQQTWQSQSSAPLAIEPGALLAKLRARQRTLRTTLVWRDSREVIVAAVMTVFFTVWGFGENGWPWLVLAAGSAWVGGFILVDRWLRRRHAARFDESVLGFVEASLEEVNHQIWLLRNVQWWYLLPLFVGMVAEFGTSAFGKAGPLWLQWCSFLLPLAFVGVVFAFVFWLNKMAIRKELEPRRQELLAVRESLLGQEVGMVA